MPDNEETPPPSSSDPKEKKPKKPGYWSKYFEKHPKQHVSFKRFKKVYFFYLLVCLLISFPTIRALFYPAVSLIGHFNLDIQATQPVYTTKESPTFILESSTCNRYDLRVFKREDFLEKRHGIDIDASYPCNDVAVNPSVDGCRVSEASFSPNAKPVHQEFGFLLATDIYRADKRVIVGSLPAGDYVAVFRGYNDLRMATDWELRSIRVTDLGLIVKQDDQQLLVHSVSLFDGSKKPGITTHLYSRPGDDDGHELKALGSFKTDSDGFLMFQRPKDMSDKSWERMTVDAQEGNNKAYQGDPCTDDFTIDYENSRPYDVWFDRYKVFLTGDRPIYKLGNKVQYKGVVRYHGDLGMKNLGSGTKVKIEITDPQGDKAASNEFVTDGFGTFNGSFEIPKTGKTGWYSFAIETPDKKEHSFRVLVSQYRKPEYVIRVTPEKKISFAGDKMRIKVTGTYYFGGAVPGAEVKYTIRSSPSAEARMSLFKDAAGEELYYFGRYLNTTGVVKSDEKGEAIIEVDTKQLALGQPNSDLYDFQDSEVIADVEMTDTTNHKTQLESGKAICVRANLALDIGVTDRIVKAGKPIEVKVKAAIYEGELPDLTKVTVELRRHVRKNFLSNEFENKLIASTEAQVGKDGVATASIPTKDTFPAGWYHVVCRGVDGQGRQTGSTASLDITSDTTDTLATSGSDSYVAPLMVSFDKPSYKHTEQARVIITTPTKKGESKDVLLSVEGTRLHEYRIVHLDGPTVVVPIQIRDEYAPQAWVTAVLIDKEHNPHVVSESLNVDASFHFLDIEMTPLKKAYRAGDTAKCLVKAKYQDGKPAANSQLSFAMSDLSIYAVANEAKKREYYYDSSPSSALEAFWGEVTNHVTTKFSFEEPHLLTLESKPFVDQVGLYGLCLHLGPIIPLMMTNRMTCQESELCAKKQDLEAKMSASLSRENRGMPMEQAIAKSAEIPKTKGFANGAEEPRVRKEFNDMAAWYPSITTDAKGEATVTIKLPDDLTTWKGECTMVDAHANVGSQTTTILTTQDFIARLGLPRFFTQGDKTIIEGTVHNYSDAPQPVTLTLTVSPQLKVGTPLATKVNIPKGGHVTHKWPIEVVGEGEASVTFKAVGATAGDALKQKLPCRPLGYRAFFAKAGVIKDANGVRPFPINIPPDAKLATGSFEMTLSSSQIGPVLGSFDTLIDYPYGCTEQTLSRLIPSVVAMRLHTELGVDLSEASKAKFQEVYDLAMPKLQEYQHSDGGWGWWAKDESRAFLTAQVLEGFHWLGKAEYAVDVDRAQRAVSYLETATNALFQQPWEENNAVDHAKALYVLSLYEREMPLTQKAWQLAKLRSLPPEALAYLTMAFKNVNDEKAAKTFYDRLLELKNESNEYINWDHTQAMISKFHPNDHIWAYTYRFTGVETSALALRAVLAMEPQKEELIDAIVRWIILQRDENGWNNTKSTSQVFVALLERELATRPDRTTHFKARVKSGEKLLSMLEFNKPVESGERFVRIGINPKPDHIKLEKEGPGWLYYTSLLQYDRPLRPGENVIAKSKPDDLKITREFFRLIPYKDAKTPMTREQAISTPVSFYVREPIGNEPIHAGDVIQMRVSIDSPISIPYVMVESALPSGGEVINKYMSVIDKAQLKPDYTWDYSASWWWDHQDVLDDRMGFFVGSMKEGKCTVEALIRMERPGEFGVNPVTLETMYSKHVRGYSKIDRLKVVE